MSNQRPGMFVPALIGGVVAGVLSGIPIINCLCCLWIIGGAMLASYLLAKDSSVALSAGDGAIVGIFTGIIAAVLSSIIKIPLSAMSREFFRNLMERFADYAEEMPSGIENWLQRANIETSIFWSMLLFLISVIIYSALGALGGIIGISLFGKRFFPSKGQGVIDVPKDTSNR